MKAKASLIFGFILITVSLAGCGGGGGGGDVATSTPSVQQDTSKPVVNSSTPAHNSTGVGTTSAITLTFNEEIDPATINPKSFTILEGGTTPIAGSITYVGKTAQFTPATNLSVGATYTATVTTGVKDLAGNALAASYAWQFTTGSGPDSVAPTVITTYPASNSVNIALNSSITLTFNEEVEPATINAQTIIVLKDGTMPVAGSFTYIGTTTQFTPASILSAGASYSVTVTTGVKDLAGNAIAAPYTWVFTTANSNTLDTTGPQIQSVSPPVGSKNVSIDSALEVSFNEPIMPFYYGLINGRPVAVTFNDTYTTITLKPTITMNSGSTYTTYIRVKDMAGNLMPAAFIWQFSTSP